AARAVGGRLARMPIIGERVADVKVRSRGSDPLEPRLCVGAYDGGMHPALEIPGDVADRLTAAERDVLRRLDHVAAELANRDLKRRTCSERRFLEEQGDVSALERPLVSSADAARLLEAHRLFQTGAELV